MMGPSWKGLGTTRCARKDLARAEAHLPTLQGPFKVGTSPLHSMKDCTPEEITYGCPHSSRFDLNIAKQEDQMIGHENHALEAQSAVLSRTQAQLNTASEREHFRPLRIAAGRTSESIIHRGKGACMCTSDGGIDSA